MCSGFRILLVILPPHTHIHAKAAARELVREGVEAWPHRAGRFGGGIFSLQLLQSYRLRPEMRAAMGLGAKRNAARVGFRLRYPNVVHECTCTAIISCRAAKHASRSLVRILITKCFSSVYTLCFTMMYR